MWSKNSGTQPQQITYFSSHLSTSKLNKLVSSATNPIHSKPEPLFPLSNVTPPTPLSL